MRAMNRIRMLVCLIFLCTILDAQVDTEQVQITELPVGPEKKGQNWEGFTCDPKELRLKTSLSRNPTILTREPTKKLPPRKRRAQAAAQKTASAPAQCRTLHPPIPKKKRKQITALTNEGAPAAEESTEPTRKLPVRKKASQEG